MSWHTVSPPSWDIKPHNVTLYVGQQYKLPCKAHGYPIPSHFWSHDGSLVIDRDVKVQGNNYLFFSDAKSSHSGWYTCTVSNVHGTISHSVYVDVVAGMSVTLFYHLYIHANTLLYNSTVRIDRVSKSLYKMFFL